MTIYNSKNKKLKSLILILTVLISSLMLGLIFNKISNSAVNKIDENQYENEKNDDLLNELQSSDIAPWWNGTFRYRTEINLTEPGYSNRNFEPVDIDMTFEDQKCHKDTIRVIEYIPGVKNEEIHSQLWDVNYYSGNTFIRDCKVTFLATVQKGENSTYYIYYSDDNNDEKIINPKNRYITESGFSSSLDEINDKLSISTTEYDLELEKGRGVFNFSKGGVNYHTDNSLTPWIKNANYDDNIYYPDDEKGGAIHNWLGIGAFGYSSGDDPPTGQYHFDMSKEYIKDDYALGGTLPERYLDENKQWLEIEFNTTSYYDPSRYFGYLRTSNFFGEVRSFSYMSAYIMSPVDLNNVYLKWSKDDRGEVWRDGELIVRRGLPWSDWPDYYSEDLHSGGFDFEAGKWYYFIVLVDNSGAGPSGFHFRLSNSTARYDNGLSGGLSLLPNQDLNRITNLYIRFQPPYPLIDTITKVGDDQEGPVFSKYNVNWKTHKDMHVSDQITVYNNYSLWKTERTIYWDDDREDTSFSVFNTFFDDNTGEFDDYFYDSKIIDDSITNAPSDIQDYVVVRDDNGVNRISLGTFITDLETYGTTSLDNYDWGANYDSSYDIINMRPGENSDLNTDGGYNNRIKFTYWEYIDDNVGANNPEANETFFNIYNTLKNPLLISIGDVKSSFFDFTVIVKDCDDNVVEGVSVFINNKTLVSTKIDINQTTDAAGSTTFLRLPNGTYTLNFTYEKYEKILHVKNAFDVVINETKTMTVTNLNLTRLDLYLHKRGQIGNPISGADVDFYYDLGGPNEEIIGQETSDDLGKVLFIWRNMTQLESNISIKVNFLEIDPLLINSSTNPVDNFVEYLNYTFDHETADNIEVNVQNYKTNLDIISPETGEDPIIDKFIGDTINLTVWYYWTNESTGINTTITGEDRVTFTIRDSFTQEVKGTGTFDDPAMHPGNYYNFTLDTELQSYNLLSGSSYRIEIIADKPGYQKIEREIPFILLAISTNLTAFDEVGGTELNYIEVPWRENFSFVVFYNDTKNSPFIGLNESEVIYSVSILGQPFLSGNLTELTLDGWYNLTLNTTEFINIGLFSLLIFASKSNYEYQYISVIINITLIHTNLVPNKSNINVYWNDNFSIEVTFRDTDNDLLVESATASYVVLGTTQMGNLQNEGNGNYSLTLNSSFTSAFSYTLKITASYSNYETQELNIPLNILPIRTLLNGKKLEIVTTSFYVGTSHQISFHYNTTGGAGINNARATFDWQKGSETVYTENLYNTTIDGKYILDFNTELRTIGTYSLAITLEKDNYETRSATYIITIKPREIDAELSAEGLKDDQINIVKGNEVELEVELIDSTTGEKIRGADVVLELGDDELEFDEDKAGIYVYTFTTKEYEAFYTSLTLTGEINIKVANYTSETIDLTIVIEMEEVYEDVPLFYFIIMVGAIAAVIGSLATYKIIQVAKIPKFVKKARAMKKVIKGKKEISESLLTESKDELIFKEFRDDWEEIGLSLRDTLDLKEKKEKIDKGTDKISKDKGGAQ